MAAPPSKTLQNITGKWTLNTQLSDDPTPAMKLQEVNAVVRKAATTASVHMQISQPDKDHVKMKQTATAMGIPGAEEDYRLDWEWRTESDPLFGDIKSRSRWVGLGDAKSEGAEGNWIEGDSEGMLLQAEAKKPDDVWGAVHFIGFDHVDGDRRLVRRTKVWRHDGQEHNMIMVYDFNNE